MSPILLYLPKAKALTPGLVAEHAIDTLFGHRATREIMNGPSGPGLLVSESGTDPDRMVVNPERQRWSPRFGSTSLIGTWNDLPQPTPIQLARTKQLPGVSVRLLDGKEWLIPLLRAWHAGDPPIAEIVLPRILSQCPDTGRLILGRVIPIYQDIWERSLQVCNQLLQFQGSINDDLANSLALDLLAINYRVDASVISHLELLTPDLCGLIIKHALDLGTLEGLLKNVLSRSVSSGTNSSSGETPPTEASSITTDQPSAN